ncbi:MAG: hypothetical protein ACLQPD_19270 [Desulfomonilaceae bacterium]
METSKKSLKKGGNSGTQRAIIRFRASDALHERLKYLAAQEEMCLAGLVRRLVLDSLKKFPD